MPFSLIRSVARIHEFYLRRLTGFNATIDLAKVIFGQIAFVNDKEQFTGIPKTKSTVIVISNVLFLYLFKLDQVLGNFIINHQFNKIKKYFTLTFVKK